MKLNAYSIRDLAADSYSAPFFTSKDAIAVRLLTDLVNDVRHEYSKYHKDYVLFCVGAWDSEKAVLSSAEARMICSATSLVNAVVPANAEVR